MTTADEVGYMTPRESEAKAEAGSGKARSRSRSPPKREEKAEPLSAEETKLFDMIQKAVQPLIKNTEHRTTENLERSMQASFKAHQTATTTLMRDHMTQLTEMVRQSEQTLRGEMSDMRVEFRREIDALKNRDNGVPMWDHRPQRRCRHVKATSVVLREKAITSSLLAGLT